MAVPRLSSAVETAALSAALAEHGCAIVEGLAPPALLAAARRELEPWMARTAPGFHGEAKPPVPSRLSRMRTGVRAWNSEPVVGR